MNASEIVIHSLTRPRRCVRRSSEGGFLTAGTAVSFGLALALGLRHGLDADHLAAIDGLTRWNAARRSPLAGLCGALFSAGHGTVIVLAAVGLAMLGHEWVPPAWLAAAGVFISTATLILLSALNLRVALSLQSGEEMRPTGMRSYFCAGLLRTSRPLQVALVGAAFALSFDAFGLAALFAATAMSSGGPLGTGALALVFAAAMIAVDTLNGVWVARLLARSDHASRHASRIMTVTVAVVGLLVGLSVALSAVIGPLERWIETHDLMLSTFVVGAILAASLAARWLPQPATMAGDAGYRAED